MLVEPVGGGDLAEAATSSEPPARRAEQFLTLLRRVIPFDGAWLGLADPFHPSYTMLASLDLADPVLECLAGPQGARDMEETGADRLVRPWSPSDMPFPVDELPGWAECLIPAGYRGGLALAVHASGGRHVGFLGLPWAGREAPTPGMRQWLADVVPLLGHAVDPLRSLSAIAGLVQGAFAGVLLHEDGPVVALPGLAGHALLDADSALVPAARAELAAAQVHATFLWPLGGCHAPDGHAQVHVMRVRTALAVRLDAMVLLAPPPHLQGLTPRELQILGLLVRGDSNAQIARALVVSARTVAAHLEHILAKLAASTRTLAAVHAQRSGLYVPWWPS